MSSSVVEYQHPAIEAVAAISAELDQLAESSLWSMPVADLGQLVVSLERLSRRFSATQIAVPARADSSQIATSTGATSTAAWLRNVADVPVWLCKSRSHCTDHWLIVPRPGPHSARRYRCRCGGRRVRGDARTTRRSAGRTEQRDRRAPGRDSARRGHSWGGATCCRDLSSVWA
jgi:hypothetical protein